MLRWRKVWSSNYVLVTYGQRNCISFKIGQSRGKITFKCTTSWGSGPCVLNWFVIRCVRHDLSSCSAAAGCLKRWILVRLFVRLETAPRLGHCDVAIKVPWKRFENCRLSSRAHFLKSNCTGSNDDTALLWLARLTHDNFDACFVIILTPSVSPMLKSGPNYLIK